MRTKLLHKISLSLSQNHKIIKSRLNQNLSKAQFTGNSTLDRRSKSKIKTRTRSRKSCIGISNANFIAAGWKVVDSKICSKIIHCVYI